jgi:hypothetical protein
VTSFNLLRRLSWSPALRSRKHNLYISQRLRIIIRVHAFLSYTNTTKGSMTVQSTWPETRAYLNRNARLDAGRNERVIVRDGR